MKSSVSIALFFLLSGFFLAVLLSALEHSRKLLAVAVACLAAVVCIIVFLTPVELPSFHFGSGGRNERTVATGSASGVATTGTGVRPDQAGLAVSTTASVTLPVPTNPPVLLPSSSTDGWGSSGGSR